MSAYDPSLDPNNLPTSSGQLPQFQPQSTATPAYASYSSGNSQLANGNGTTIGVNNMPASTSTTYAPVASATPYNPNAAPAAQSYAPMQGDLGFDATSPGTGENVSASILNHYAQSGIPGTTQNAQGAYGQFQASTPTNMNPYYDNASRNSANAINTQMAARGSYGSSNAVGVLSNAETNLRAQQAKDEAGYGLQRAGLAGTLASGADSSSAAHSADERNWVGALSDLGFQNQKEGAARFQMGYGIANNLANTASGIENTTGSAEIDQQTQLLTQQFMSQGMTASDAATAAHNTVAAQNASDARAVDTTEKAVQTGAMFV